MEQNPSWEAHFVCNLKIHYYLHNNPSCFCKTTLVLSSFLCLSISNVCLLSGFFKVKTLNAFQLSLMHATYPVHLVSPSLITLIILDEQYRSWNCLVHTFLYPSIASSLLGKLQRIAYVWVWLIFISLCNSSVSNTGVSPYITIYSVHCLLYVSLDEQPLNIVSLSTGPWYPITWWHSILVSAAQQFSQL